MLSFADRLIYQTLTKDEKRGKASSKRIDWHVSRENPFSKREKEKEREHMISEMWSSFIHDGLQNKKKTQNL